MFTKKIKYLVERLFKSKNILKYFLLKIYYRITKQKYITSHFADIKNFGDNFNFDLLNHFGYKLIWTPCFKKSQVALTGSILGAYLRNYNGYVLGSGFLWKRYNRVPNNWKIVLIRGPLSAKQCGAEVSDFGDPAILASVIYSGLIENSSPKFEIGILPHMVDYNYFSKIQLENVLIINPRQESKIVASEILNCKTIASSSLHGLIYAESFRIPNVHIILSNNVNGGLHKFRDYYLGMNSEYKNINLLSCDDKTKIDFEHLKNNAYLAVDDKNLERRQKIIYKKIKRTLSLIDN